MMEDARVVCGGPSPRRVFWKETAASASDSGLQRRCPEECSTSSLSSSSLFLKIWSPD
jgi:hypothetical protein